MSTIDTGRIIALDDGFHVLSWTKEKPVNYKYGLRYWSIFQYLVEVYLYLKVGIAELDKDTCGYIVKIMFNDSIGRLLEQQSNTWSISNSTVHINESYLIHASIIEADSAEYGSKVIYHDKPLFVPHEVFHRDARDDITRKEVHESVLLLESAASWRLFSIRCVRIWCLYGFLTSMYQALASGAVEEVCYRSSTLGCGTLINRIIVAFIMQFTSAPFNGICILLGLFTISYSLITVGNIHGLHKCGKRWRDMLKEREHLGIIKAYDISEYFKKKK